MTDHKFTDDDVIKAFGYCTGNYSDDCRGKICPYENIAFCYAELQDDALALINRQKAEIEKLRKGISLIFSNKQMEEIKNDCLERVEYNINAIKSEAIKEFAQRLKVNTFEVDDLNEDIFYAVEVSYIDYLVKEMTEENK